MLLQQLEARNLDDGEFDLSFVHQDARRELFGSFGVSSKAVVSNSPGAHKL